MQFNILSSLILAALTLGALGSPVGSPSTAVDATSGGPVIARGVVSVAQMKHWIDTTSANLTFIGEPKENIGLSPLTTTVTFCSHVTNDFCSGPCNVYTGAGICLATPDTNCISATTNVAFCDHAGCSGSCNLLANCGTTLDDGYCYTPGTNSISFPA